MNTVVYIFPLF